MVKWLRLAPGFPTSVADEGQRSPRASSPGILLRDSELEPHCHALVDMSDGLRMFAKKTEYELQRLSSLRFPLEQRNHARQPRGKNSHENRR